MKNLLIGTLVFIFSFSVLAANSEPDGFRKIKWEEPISKYKGVMRLIEGKGTPNKYYVRKNDKMSIGDVKLKNIGYGFYKDKFSGVVISTEKSVSNSTQLLNILEKKFGKAYQANKYIKEYYWSGQTATIYMKCNSYSRICTLVFSSVAMSDLKKADKEAAAKKAQSDF